MISLYHFILEIHSAILISGYKHEKVRVLLFLLKVHNYFYSVCLIIVVQCSLGFLFQQKIVYVYNSLHQLQMYKTWTNDLSVT